MSRFDDLMCRWVASGFDVGRNAAGEGKIEVGNPLEPCQGSQPWPACYGWKPQPKNRFWKTFKVAHLPVINVVIAIYNPYKWPYKWVSGPPCWICPKIPMLQVLKHHMEDLLWLICIPSTVLPHHWHPAGLSEELTEFEQGEILDFPQIWYLRIVNLLWRLWLDTVTIIFCSCFFLHIFKYDWIMRNIPKAPGILVQVHRKSVVPLPLGLNKDFRKTFFLAMFREVQVYISSTGLA